METVNSKVIKKSPIRMNKFAFIIGALILVAALGLGGLLAYNVSKQNAQSNSPTPTPTATVTTSATAVPTTATPVPTTPKVTESKPTPTETVTAKPVNIGTTDSNGGLHFELHSNSGKKTKLHLNSATGFKAERTVSSFGEGNYEIVNIYSNTAKIEFTEVIFDVFATALSTQTPVQNSLGLTLYTRMLDKDDPDQYGTKTFQYIYDGNNNVRLTGSCIGNDGAITAPCSVLPIVSFQPEVEYLMTCENKDSTQLACDTLVASLVKD